MKRLCADDVTDSMPLFRSGRGGAIPTSALQLQISRCKVHRACDLNALWHSRFPKIDWSNVVRNKDYACYVAEYDDIAYAVAIWSSPIAANRLTEGKTALELRRMAICDNAPPNTASRMIGIMRRIIAKEMPHLTILVSYQDTDVHAGTIYKASGWKAVAQNKGTSWTNENRKRNEEQSLADKVRWEYRLKPMQDYWNDPPEYPEVPECCDQEMNVDDQGNCRCAVCGKTIERQPDPEPPEMPEFNWENNTMQLTQKAKELIARVESERNRLHLAQPPITSIIPASRKPAPQMKKAPADLNRRKYSNWGGVDTFRFAGENKQRQPLTDFDL